MRFATFKQNDTKSVALLINWGLQLDFWWWHWRLHEWITVTVSIAHPGNGIWAGKALDICPSSSIFTDPFFTYLNHGGTQGKQKIHHIMVILH